MANFVLLVLLFLFACAAEARSKICSGIKKTSQNLPAFEKAQSWEDCLSTEAEYETCKSLPKKLLVTKGHACKEKILLQEIDLRLVPMKRRDLKQYERELKLQTDFNKMTIPLCRGKGFGSEETDNCLDRLQAWRYKQIADINNNALTLKCRIDSEKSRKLPKNKNLDGFIKGLCDLPDGIWKSKPTQKDCHQETRACLAKLIVPSEENGSP